MVFSLVSLGYVSDFLPYGNPGGLHRDPVSREKSGYAFLLEIRSFLLLGNLVGLYRNSASAGSQALPILLENWKKLKNIKMEAFY